eukprot:5725183-Alexandrium_andersonii.AAC.1
MERSQNKQPRTQRAVSLDPNPEVRTYEDFPDPAQWWAREIADVLRDSGAPRRGGHVHGVIRFGSLGCRVSDLVCSLFGREEAFSPAAVIAALRERADVR